MKSGAILAVSFIAPLVFLAAPISAFAANLSIDQDGTTITVNDALYPEAHNYRVYTFASDGSFFYNSGLIALPVLPLDIDQTPFVDGTNYTLLFTYNANDAGCDNHTLTECEAYATIGGDEFIALDVSPPPPPPPPPPDTGAVGDLVALGETAFASTTGENLGAAVSWAGDNLVLLWVGSGIALLGGVSNWLVALLIISTITTWGYLYWRYRKTGSWRKT